jgi:hypothetical protein
MVSMQKLWSLYPKHNFYSKPTFINSQYVPLTQIISTTFARWDRFFKQGHILIISMIS